MEKILSEKIGAMEKVVSEKVNSIEKGFQVLERLVFAAMAVFIFGKQIASGITDVVESQAVRGCPRT